ncbi:LysR substrate-binding domain-containing protein [Sansalvadorimonas sp. 2012CJ34-2]|uniref:LysR substrate-binding domain-containing protein n=1 Tax=Parendozoicomonas callyspongiae TaxID=2942213 RepID=A0ABT0PGX5_9GAMM|nr:LysR substrate-binding domain-containing protein [Sansalvadorimonas sp. 2012CJ34-2]MCL6270634.1 LysR substrate-binding domain-containing protein [Sansalvadorimonas sp. 2012CJ34-2]
MNRLRYMSVFAHIVEAGSITAAADALDLSKSVISQHLKALEQELGLQLLKRTTRKQVLTPEGKTFYQQCRHLNGLVDQAWEQVQSCQNTPQGHIRITASDAMMSYIVAPAISQMLKQYPLLKPELISSDSHLNIMTAGIDLAIRVGQSKDASLKQRRIGSFRDVLCGHQQIVENGEVNEAGYIANHWQSKEILHELKHSEMGDHKIFATTPSCRADSFHTCLTLIQSGAGIGLIPDFVISQTKNQLQPVFPDYQLKPNPVYALHPYDQLVSVNVKVCLQAIENQLAKSCIPAL